MIRYAIVIVTLVCLGACTGVRVLPATPKIDYAAATVPGYEDIRIWGDEAPPAAAEGLRTIRTQIAARARRDRALPNRGQFDVLVLSGGGSDGAYGAGLLNGWTERGDRPEFGLVTGISTGALIAPFAFLGPEYDDELERFYTNTKTDNLVELTIFKALIGSALSLTDTTPLVRTLDLVLTEEVVRRIGEEHNKGRRLWIGTTNLDAQRPVIWDIGQIALSGNPGARRLIQKIMLASAAIPGAFPPVQFVVQANGEEFSEMHVDGGVTRQLFLYPSSLSLSAQDADTITQMRLGTIYVVRNTKLDPDYQPTDAGVLPIAARSISTLIKAAGVADIRVLEDQARRDGFALRLTSVPDSFAEVEQELFDAIYMRKLYDVGYRRAVSGVLWTNAQENTKP